MLQYCRVHGAYPTTSYDLMIMNAKENNITGLLVDVVLITVDGCMMLDSLVEARHSYNTNRLPKIHVFILKMRTHPRYLLTARGRQGYLRKKTKE
jgi:hypothetical protein